MGRIATTVAGLGTPDTDGEPGAITVAAPSGVHHERLFWNAAEGCWVGRPKFSNRMTDVASGFARGGSAGWFYLSSTVTLDSLIADSTGFGFQIHEVPYAGELWAAGLRLQEHLSALFFGGSGAIPRVALNWYDLADGDGFLSPAPTNIGVFVEGDANDAAYPQFHSSGWQFSPVAAPTPPKMWYPEVYANDAAVSAASFNTYKLTARYRWVSTAGAAGGSDGSKDRPPILDQLSEWHRADSIALPDGAAVAEWVDYARGRGLYQPTGSKQPTLVKGWQNGRAAVRFDGVNDLLSRSTAAFGAPVTVFMVMSQRAEGGAQQVWFGGGGGGAPLFYRNDATDQVNLWTGGSDIIYHRPGGWPMPPRIMSVEMNGASSNVWENKTVRVTGNPGANGIGGLCIGASGADSLYAAIDVAEVLVYARAFTNGERNTMIDWLNARYAIF